MKLLFFGRLGSLMGREVEIDLPPDGRPIADVRRMLIDANPAAASELASPSIRASVDRTIVSESFIIRPEHEVAFFSPLSGG